MMQDGDHVLRQEEGNFDIQKLHRRGVCSSGFCVLAASAAGFGILSGLRQVEDRSVLLEITFAAQRMTQLVAASCQPKSSPLYQVYLADGSCGCLLPYEEDSPR